MNAPTDSSRSPGLGALTGTGHLIRFMLRRDRIRISVWILVITLFTVVLAATLPGAFQNEAELQARADSLASPARVALTGSIPDLEVYTYGAIHTNTMLVMMSIVVALMSMFFIIRHSRTEEETGRTELVRAAVVGRHANMTAALVVVAAVNIVLGAIIALSLGLLGIESMTWTGSIAFGAALAGVGLVFAGVAALTAQLTEYGRGATGMALAILGLTYGLRAAGDVGENALSWLSPMGWAQAMGPYVDDRWWPLLLSLGAMAGLVGAALALSTRRDVGAGVMPSRPGPPAASESLVRPVGLALRLQRGGLIGWSIGLLVFGIFYGNILGDAESLIEDNQVLQDILAAEGMDLADSYRAMVVSLLALLSSVFAIQATLRLRSEETSGQAEPVLGTAVSRARWAASHLTVAAIGSVAILLAAALGLGTTAAMTLDDTSVFPQLLGASLAYVPVLWLTSGVAVALFGFLPRLSALAWVIPAYAIVVIFLGGLLQFPAWLVNLSPFEHIPQLPAEPFSAMPVVLIGLLAAGLIAIGLAAFERRDLHSV